MFLVTLDFRVFHLTTNQTFSVKDSVFRVGVEGILGGITDTTTMGARSEARPRGLTNQRLTVVPHRRRIPMKG